MLIYSHKAESMGKAAGDIVQERVADVEAGAVAYACGATADRDRCVVISRKAKQRLQLTGGRASPDPGCHRPKGTA
jgi:hypothetical protein